MSLLRISEAAERSGVPISTLRFYERIGLVEPLGRAENGYRLYDESTVERLAFVGRAKRLGMTLEDAATLAGPWFDGDCGPLRGRLYDFVSGRLVDVRRQIAEDRAFERQLQRILGRLGQRRDVAGRCRPDCGCDIDPLESDDLAAPNMCTLGGVDGYVGCEEWRRMFAMRSAPSVAPARFRPCSHHRRL